MKWEGTFRFHAWDRVISYIESMAPRSQNRDLGHPQLVQEQAVRGLELKNLLSLRNFY
jgi:hypothetical protein